MKKYVKILVSAMLVVLLMASSCLAGTIKREENVYVKMDSHANSVDTIVVNKITSNKELKEYRDESVLDDVMQLNGEGNLNNEDDMITWNVEGKELYYKGKSNKKLPIELELKYFYEGKETEIEDIIGKSGRIEIRIKAINLEKRICNVGSEKRSLYVPFYTVVAVMLDRNVFKNIEMDNGHLIDDGNMRFAVSALLPGMKENIDSELVSFNDTFVLKADVDEFSMKDIYAITSNKLKDVDSFEIMEKAEETNNKILSLNSASNKLKDGSVELKDGIAEYGNKHKELNIGINSYVGGVSLLMSGINQLESPTDELVKSTSSFKEQMVNYEQSANKYFDAGSKLFKSTKALKEGMTEYSNNLELLKEGFEKIADPLKNLSDNENKLYELDVKLNESIALQNMKVNELMASIDNELAKLSKEDENFEILTNLKSQLGTIESMQSKHIEISNQVMISKEEFKDGIDKLNISTEKLVNATNEVNVGSLMLIEGFDEYQNGLASFIDNGVILAKGLTEFKDASIKLEGCMILYQNGFLNLKDGATRLNQKNEEILFGLNKLDSGYSDILNGMMQFCEKLEIFNDEGINVLTKEGNLLFGKTKNTIELKNALIKLSEEYGSYSSLNKNEDTEIKFIMKIEGTSN